MVTAMMSSLFAMQQHNMAMMCAPKNTPRCLGALADAPRPMGSPPMREPMQIFDTHSQSPMAQLGDLPKQPENDEVDVPKGPLIESLTSQDSSQSPEKPFGCRDDNPARIPSAETGAIVASAPDAARTPAIGTDAIVAKSTYAAKGPALAQCKSADAILADFMVMEAKMRGKKAIALWQGDVGAKPASGPDAFESATDAPSACGLSNVADLKSEAKSAQTQGAACAKVEGPNTLGANVASAGGDAAGTAVSKVKSTSFLVVSKTDHNRPKISHEASRSQFLVRSGVAGRPSKRFKYDDAESKERARVEAEALLKEWKVEFQRLTC